MIDGLFDRMDAWRHLPSYQLERRADLFFSLYLKEVLEAKLGFKIQPTIIPEFPVRIGSIYPDDATNKSFKIDYLTLSQDARQAVFVELKTEGLSRRTEQDEYLIAAKDAGLEVLLDGLLEIFRASNSKRKYFHLLDTLASVNLLAIPAQMYALMEKASPRGSTAASRDIKITCPVAVHHIIYIQPNGNGDDIISFSDFKAVVECHDDPLSFRFAQSLSEWADIQAGVPKIIDRKEP